jgi:hypothetical protein
MKVSYVRYLRSEACQGSAGIGMVGEPLTIRLGAPQEGVAMGRFRMVEDIDWQRLNGSKVTVQVSASYIVLEEKDGSLVKIAKVMHPRRPADPAPLTKPKRLKAAEEG